MPTAPHFDLESLDENEKELKSWYHDAPFLWPHSPPARVSFDPDTGGEWQLFDAYRRSGCLEFAAQIAAAVEKACAETAEEGWYGPGSRRIDRAACERALAFSRMIPREYPMPEIIPHPDGAIAFEWYRGPRLVLTVSTGLGEKIHFAALLGKGKRHGSEESAGQVLDTIEQILTRLYSIDPADEGQAA